MSNQPTTRPEPEALHRSMMQASLQVAELDRRVEQERRRDGLGAFLTDWRDAAAGLRTALAGARANLLAGGTASGQLDGIERRLEHLHRRASAFDVSADLDECIASWAQVAHEIAALRGPHRDEIVRLLAARKDAIDRATAGLSRARAAGGMHPEQRARLRAVEDERERTRERYARLRDDYLRAARGRATHPAPGVVAPAVVTLPELLAPRGLLRAAPPRLDAVIERDRHLRVGVAQRFEKTLGSLATASHRTLVDPRAGELRGHLARMDGILARLQGKRTASELSEGAREVGGLLARMGDLAAAGGGALKPFRALLEERRAALARLAGEAQKAAGARALHQRGALPQPSAAALGERQLQTLRRLHPGIERLLRDSSASQLSAELRHPAAHAPLGPAGLQGLSGMREAGSHLGALGVARSGGLGALAEHGAIRGSPLLQIARTAEDRRREAVARAKARVHGRRSDHPPAGALAEAFRTHGRGDFAAHVAPGGALYHLLQGAQRSQGLPVAHLASHFVQSRGSHPLLATVQLFERLRAEGYQPRFGLFGRFKHAASDAFHQATTAVARTTGEVARTAGGLAEAGAGAVRAGISDFAHQAQHARHTVVATVHAAARGVGQAAGSGAAQLGRGVGSMARGLSSALQHGSHRAGDEAAGLYRAARGAATRVTHTVGDLAQGGVHRATQLGAAVMRRAGDAAQNAYGFAGAAAHTGLDALHRTGIAGGIGKGVRFGVSMLKTAARYSPVGLALQGFHKAGGLQGIWEKTKHTAGAAWQGVQKTYRATAGFLQSPAGQLLVTGLSLAATFVPGGVVVKSLVGGAIGAIQAISEGKDWKHVLLAAGTGALTGALPFLKLGPLAGMGIGALTGAASALASGSSLKGALKAAAGGALDSFDPGALKALGRLKGLQGARKIFQGKQLSKLEKRVGLEKVVSGGVRAGILVSGKAAKAQGYLEKAVAMGDRIEGGLSLIHELAPEVAGTVGDNAFGRLIARAGEYAGEGDDRLKRALDIGHGASDRLQRYRGYLDKGLHYAGVKDPRKAYARRMAREAAREGKREGIEAVAREKLERHRRRHPERHEEPHLMRRAHFEEHGRAPRRHEPRSALEKALARGKKLKRQGLEVTQGVHDGLRKIYGTVAKGLQYAGHVEGGLEKAVALARQGAGVLGTDTELGAYLAHVADRAEQARNHLAEGIHLAREFDDRVGKVEGGLELIPGVRPEGAPKRHERIHHAPEPEHLKHHAGGKHAHVAREPEEDDRLHAPLQAAARGNKGLHEGRNLLEEALHLGAQRHVENHHREEHVGLEHPDRTHLEDPRGAAGGEAEAAYRGGAHSDAHAAVEDAALAVAHFGGAVGAAAKAARSLLERDQGAQAAERIQSLEDLSAHAGATVTEAARAASGEPALAGKAAALQQNLVEIRGHFRRFVSGLSGLESKEAREGEKHPGHPRHLPGGRRAPRAEGDLVDEVLRGIDDGRVFADRGADRGERPDHDRQGIDSAAIDGWIGSGEGVNLFSEVFGPFLPADSAARRGGRHRRGGRGSRGGHENPGSEPGGREPRRGKRGFFGRMSQRLEDFAEGVHHVAHAGAGLLGKAMHYAETGMHGLTPGEGKGDLEVVESPRNRTAKVAHKAGQRDFGEMQHLFRAATDGDGTDGKLRPERVRLGSALDEPRRLDALTQARMGQFLGGDFGGVRVHVGPGAAQITSRYAAEAVTVKDHIFFAPGKFSPGTEEGQKLLAHELTHVLQKGRKNLDVRTAESEALHAEHSYRTGPAMETLNLSRPAPDFRLPDGEGLPGSDGIHTAKRTRSRGHDAAAKDEMPDGEEFLEKVSGRVYELLLDELEQSFESR